MRAVNSSDTAATRKFRRAAVVVAILLGCAVAPTTAAAWWSAAPEGRWEPEPTTRPWQLQLSGRIDTSVGAPVYDIDGLRTPARVVRRLARRGRRVVCYFSAGTYEPFRADAERFPAEAIGRRLRDFPDERWLDIRRLDLLAPLLRRRLDVCERKGFDAADPDNVDGYANRSGFAITAADQLRFNRWLASEAHARGLAVGLKNDAGQVRRLVRSFDFAVVEECFEFRECRRYSPFIGRGKPVYSVEYAVRPRRFCARSRRLGFSTVFKRLELGPFRRTCARVGKAG